MEHEQVFIWGTFPWGMCYKQSEMMEELLHRGAEWLCPFKILQMTDSDCRGRQWPFRYGVIPSRKDSESLGRDFLGHGVYSTLDWPTAELCVNVCGCRCSPGRVLKGAFKRINSCTQQQPLSPTCEEARWEPRAVEQVMEARGLQEKLCTRNRCARCRRPVRRMHCRVKFQEESNIWKQLSNLKVLMGKVSFSDDSSGLPC